MISVSYFPLHYLARRDRKEHTGLLTLVIRVRTCSSAGLYRLDLGASQIRVSQTLMHSEAWQHDRFRGLLDVEYWHHILLSESG